jgi:hypothetical protein
VTTHSMKTETASVPLTQVSLSVDTCRTREFSLHETLPPERNISHCLALTSSPSHLDPRHGGIMGLRNVCIHFHYRLRHPSTHHRQSFQYYDPMSYRPSLTTAQCDDRPYFTESKHNTAPPLHGPIRDMLFAHKSHEMSVHTVWAKCGF